MVIYTLRQNLCFRIWCITFTVALICVSTLWQRPAFSRDFAIQRAACSAELSTWKGSFPENAPPPWTPTCRTYQEWASGQSVQHQPDGQITKFIHKTNSSSNPILGYWDLWWKWLHLNLNLNNSFLFYLSCMTLFTMFTFPYNCLMKEFTRWAGVLFRNVLSHLCCSHFWKPLPMQHNCKNNKKNAPFKSAMIKCYLCVIGQSLHSATLWWRPRT